jgi:hypothetical protein
MLAERWQGLVSGVLIVGKKSSLCSLCCGSSGLGGSIFNNFSLLTVIISDPVCKGVTFPKIL